MIELAPEHKVGLPIDNPVLLGAGTVGGGDVPPPGLALSDFGAVVVGPISRSSRAGADLPRLAKITGGFLLNTGGQNRGLSATKRKIAPLWPRLGCPVIAQVSATDGEELRAVVRGLRHVDGLAGCELLLPPTLRGRHLTHHLDRLTREVDLPCLVKLSADRVSDGPAALEGGAVGIVLIAPPLGAAFRAGKLIRGELYGSVVHPLMLEAVAGMAALGLPGSIVAAGGIHTLDQAREALAAGARAVQLDSLVWVAPSRAGRLAHALSGPDE